MRLFASVRGLGLLLGAMVSVAFVPGCATESEDDTAAESGGQDLYSAANLPQEVNRRVQKCFQRNYSLDAFRSSPSTDSWGGRRVMNMDGAIWSIGTDAYDGLASVFLLGSKGAAVLHELTRDVAGTAQEQHLADYQTAELVMCITSNLITYDDAAVAKNANTNLPTPEQTTEAYKGVCANFSRVAIRILNDVGVHAELQSGELYGPAGNDRGLHAWIGVHLDSQKAFYWLEPQDDPTRGGSGPAFFNPRPDWF